ncbi:9282_t:CDS:2, partial [Entrophospora sp. SA101]
SIIRTVGVIADIDHTQDLVRIVFCINGGIIILEISKYTSKFYLNGSFASRTQFPLQNALALTTHKTQNTKIENEGGISFTEFLYQILQAYDFWYLYHKHNCTIQ